MEERSKQRDEPPLLDPPPEELVEESLNRFEGGDLNAWWILNRQLQLQPRSTHFLQDLNDDLTQLPGWDVASDETKARILAAAKRYLTEWQSDPDEWIETRTIHFPDFSGYRALVLVAELDPEFVDSLDTEQWQNLAPSIIGFPGTTGIKDESELRQKVLTFVGYQQAPETMITALLKLIDRENADEKSGGLYILRRIEECWDDQLIQSMYEKVQDPALKPSCVGDLLSELVSRGSTDATRYAKSLISSRYNDREKELAKRAAAMLWLKTEDRGWEVLWPVFQADREFFRAVITDVADERRQARVRPSGLSDQQLADLYILLSQEFPQAEDPDEDGAHWVSPRESVQHYRDNVLFYLRNLGTPASSDAIEQIRDALPHLDEYLTWVKRAAQRVTLHATWIPLTIDQIRELTQQPTTRLVRNGHELQVVILESLERLQQRLQGETPSVRYLWDKSPEGNWRPVDENALSDYIKLHLEADLRECGIVTLREVEIRRGNDTKGERTDIYVIATVQGQQPGRFVNVRVIVEVKGCWHDELQTAMETQLKNRYLKSNDCKHGIYVIGWFLCDAWDDNDSRKKKTLKWDLLKAREFFDSQSQKNN